MGQISRFQHFGGRVRIHERLNCYFFVNVNNAVDFNVASDATAGICVESVIAVIGVVVVIGVIAVIGVVAVNGVVAVRQTIHSFVLYLPLAAAVKRK